MFVITNETVIKKIIKPLAHWTLLTRVAFDITTQSNLLFKCSCFSDSDILNTLQAIVFFPQTHKVVQLKAPNLQIEFSMLLDCKHLPNTWRPELVESPVLYFIKVEYIN